MKVTPALKEELANWLDTYWTTYLKGDIETWATFIRDDYRNIGGTKEEIWNSKQEIIDYTNSILDQMLGTVDIRNRKVELIPYGEYIMVHEFTNLFVKIEGEWTFYGPFRMSSLLEKKDTGWIALHQHGSYPDMKAMEGEAFSIDALKAENARLQAAVKSRTIELEIETALERVRAEAMGMNKPDDILAICKIMFTELQLLGFSQLRNTLINFWDDDSSSLIDYDYSDDTGGNKAILTYSSHPVFEEFQKTIKNSKDAFAELIVTNEQLESWKQRRRDSGEYEDPRLNNISALYYYFYSIEVGAIGISTFSPITEEQLSVLKRFRNVFDFAYRRYADVAQAEAQAREAEIELALERVRARTMAMQRSEELVDVASVLFQQVKGLGVPQWNCGFNIWNIGDEEFTYYPGSPDGIISPSPCKIPLTEHPVFKRFDESRRQGEELLVYEKEGEEQADHYRYMLSLPGVGNLLQSMLDAGFELPKFQIDHLANFAYGNLIFITYEHFPKMHDVFKRFAKVFEQTYTRFLDLQKAEAQTREAQINLAVERVRARALAMYKSEEILELVFKLKQEMMDLDIPNVVAATIHLKEKDGNYTMWDLTAMEYSEGKLHQPMVVHYRLEEVDPNLFIKRMWDNSNPYFLVVQDEEDFKRTIQFLRDHDRKKEADESEAYLKNAGIKYGYHPTIPLQNGRMCIDLLEPPSGEIEQILTKMGAAFDLAYKRFEDLKNSEAQLKEAQIEAALERVRSRSMGMQKSEELQEVIKLVYQQLIHLKINLDHAGFVVDYTAKGDWHFWIADEQDIPSKITHPYFDSVWANQFNEAKENGADFFATHLNFEEKNKFYHELLSYVPGLTKASKDFYLNCPGLAASTVLFDNASLYIENFSGIPYSGEENSTLMRFGKVFQQTYTRFLDLQKAEAQAKEAQIETALERVRSQSMGMQTSKDLSNVTTAMFEQLRMLGGELYATGIVFCDKHEHHVEQWHSVPGAGMLSPFIVPVDLDYIHQYRYDQWKNGVELFSVEIPEDFIAKHFDAIFNLPTVKAVLDDFAAKNIPMPETPRWEIDYGASFRQGYLLVSALQHFGNADILPRFAKVFEQTYTRFLDLQKAEAQAREGQIQLALERVRARTMAMQKSEELNEVATILFNQLRSLGGHLWTCAIVLCKQNSNEDEFRTAFEGGLQPSVFVPNNEDLMHVKMYEGWKNHIELFSMSKEGQELKEHYAYMMTVPSIKPTFEKMLASGITFPIWQKWHAAYFNAGYLMIITTEPYNEEHIFVRFAKVFDQAYTRFLDLQKAEAQAKEAQVEAALERVRSRSMAMHKSDELLEAGEILFLEMQKLGIESLTAGYVLIDKEEKNGLNYTPHPGTKKIMPVPVIIPHNETIHMQQVLENWKKGHPFFIVQMDEDETIKHQTFIAERSTNFPISAAELIAISPAKLFLHNFYFKEGYILIVGGTKLSAEQTDIMLRFAKVFQQTYTRFLDLEKAEAQAREARIEAALEKVRSRTMAMQNSNELPDAANVLFLEVQKLGIPAWSCGYNIVAKDKKSATCWMSSEGVLQEPFRLRLSGEASFDEMGDFLRGEETMFIQELREKALANHYNYMKSFPDLKATFDNIDAKGLTLPTYQINHLCRFTYGFLLFITYEAVPDAHDVFKRITKVFEQTYTRFLDLQKAEAQAREAQIETGLERVRSRSLAMHNTSELQEVIHTVHKELLHLGIAINGGSFITINSDIDTTLRCWGSGGTADTSAEVILPFYEKPFCANLINRIKNGPGFFTEEYTQQEKLEFFSFLFKHAPWSNLDSKQQQETLSSPGGYTRSCCVSPNTSIFIVNHFGKIFSEDENEILKRFAKVFEQTYTRFLDLQKAEAQALEAQIETALERVRARAMAMYTSQELKEVAFELRHQMGLLGQKDLEVCAIHLYEEDNDYFESWGAMRPPGAEGKIFQGMAKFPKSGVKIVDEMMQLYATGQKDYVLLNDGEKAIEWFEVMKKHAPEAHATLIASLKGIPNEEIRAYWSVSDFSGGSLLMVTHAYPGEDSRNLLRRAANVFDLAYRRFMDLKNAEAQARESQVEAALERVRSRTLAMQKSNELAETAAVLFQQLIALGIEPNRLYISIVKSELGETEFWITDEEGNKVSTAFTANLNDNSTFLKMFEGYKQQQKSLVIVMHGKELDNYFRYLNSLGVPFKGGFSQKQRVQDIAYFSKGFIGMASTEEQPAETLQLLERFAAVFNLTFTRFNDLKIAEAHAQKAEQDLIAIKEAKQKAEEALKELQSTQKQLIQSEKMASLGELTAGIAHEIQNPLNFVNNFSEVSKELLEEMKEAFDKGDTADAKEIMNNVIQNLEKINLHGKRADGIVKGMLQHSRSGSGQKEPTDINALADEYLRLAYHGLRAKDKSFNATLKTDYDASIGKINVIPQDIGRVILNLITNAFYVISPPTTQGGISDPSKNNNPTVWVSTKKSGDMVLISVRDNGPGIPQKILDKIFQPFFTTKPTGQGTGLGLSLSYDIVKAHGGELKVETKEREGTEFLIQLPVM